MTCIFKGTPIVMDNCSSKWPAKPGTYYVTAKVTSLLVDSKDGSSTVVIR